MYIRLAGAVMILVAGGGTGLMLAHQHRKEEAALEQLIRCIEFLSWELQCRLTPLPQLCAMGAEQTKGVIKEVFQQLAIELEKQTGPDVTRCMETVLQEAVGLPEITQSILYILGQNLGRFDLNGQLSGLETVRQMSIRSLAGLQNNRDSRLRSYQVLGLCAGAALVIVLI